MVMVNLKEYKEPAKPLDKGSYVVTILSYEEGGYEYNGEFFPQYVFSFSIPNAKIDGEPVQDYIYTYSTGVNLSTHKNNKLYPLLKAVFGDNLAINSNIELDGLVGKKFEAYFSVETKKRKRDGQEYSISVIKDMSPHVSSKPKPVVPQPVKPKAPAAPKPAPKPVSNTDIDDEQVSALLDSEVDDIINS